MKSFFTKFAVLFFFAFANESFVLAQNPYLTVQDDETGLCVRMFARAGVPLAPRVEAQAPRVVELAYQAGYREEPGEAKIFVWGTNRFAPGKIKLGISVRPSNPYRGASWRYTDNNAFVLAWLKGNGTTGQSLQSFVDTSQGVYSERGERLAEYSTNGWSSEVVLELNSTEADQALVFLGRPATTDWCPTCSLALRVRLIDGQVLRAQPMLGDNQFILVRELSVAQLLADVWRAQPRVIVLPYTGEYLLATDRKVAQILRVVSYDKTWQLLRQALLAELQVVARGMDPFEVTIGQQTALDSQLFRSAAASSATADQIVFHGGCTVGGLALNLSRAHLSVRTDPANWPDLNGILPFLSQLYLW